MRVLESRRCEPSDVGGDTTNNLSHSSGGRSIQGLEIEAVYEHGVLKLPRELPLHEGQKVTITIHPPDGPVKRLYGLIPWKWDREEFDRWLNDPDEGQWGSHDVG